jgi:nucleoside 2-deoxyribosyltransferase
VIKAYLAGPDVFLPNAVEHAHRKIEICAKYGITGLAPLNQDAKPASDLGTDIKWTDIFHKDIEMMEASHIIIANLTPFRGPLGSAGQSALSHRQACIQYGFAIGRLLNIKIS